MDPQTASSEWSSPNLMTNCRTYDAIVKPRLGGTAIISSGASMIGLFSQFDNPGFAEFVLCVGIGVALLMISTSFWLGAWQLPHLETKRPLLMYALVAVLGFGSYAAVSVTANLSATAGQGSLELNQKDTIDKLENAGQAAGSYVDEMRVVNADLVRQAVQARRMEQAEIAGQGPTGVAGRGSVSNSFGVAGGKYDQAAELLQRTLAKADTHVLALEDAIAELRAAQINQDLTRAEKDARLKTLSGRAIREMRSVLALDPARSVRTAASNIAVGVPAQSRTNASSQARIAEISANMRTYANQMNAEADRIEALTPEIPEQSTLSTAERLLQTMWRLPAWTAVALLLDFMGWICVGFRVVLYQALKSKLAEESKDTKSFVATPDDFERVERAVKRMTATKLRLKTTKDVAKPAPPKPDTSTEPEGTSDE